MSRLPLQKNPRTDHDDCGVRCGCGQLLARLTPEGVEIKCKRCRTVQILPLTPAAKGKNHD